MFSGKGGNEMLGKIKKGSFITLVILLFCGSGGWVSSAEAPALARSSGAEKERVVKLIERAKKEGELLGYSSTMRPDLQDIMIPLFRKEYALSESDLKIKIVSTRTGAIVTKITEELRAKIYKTDFADGGILAWFKDLAAKGEIMADISPESKHFHPMSTDPTVGPTNPPYYITEMFGDRCIVYNPKYVKEDIAHWKDVLRPQYKGKISCSDVVRSFSHTEGWVALRTVLGVSFLKELAKQDPFLLVSSSDLINKCITGEYPINVMGSASLAFRANFKGAGLKIVFPPEGWPAMGSTTAIFTHAPHPNAAKLWVDFRLSEVGQKILLERGGYVIGRLGIESKYPEYPAPIYKMKGYIQMDWRKISDQDRDNLRAEFRRIVVEKKINRGMPSGRREGGLGPVNSARFERGHRPEYFL